MNSPVPVQAKPAPARKAPALSRSIVILPAFVIVALFLTVVYAMLGFRGPESVLRDARRALDRNEYDKSIEMLNTVEESLSHDRTDLLEQTLRMRIAAFEQLGLHEKALIDIEYLQDDMEIRDRDLTCLRIRLHNEIAADGDNEQALTAAWELAQAWLADHPDDAVVLAEAGINKDVQAAATRERWMRSLNSQVPGNYHALLRDRMNHAAFRVASQRVRDAEMAKLDAAMEEYAPGSAEITRKFAEEIRLLAGASREYYLRSLACRELVPKAYKGLATQLRAAGDDDTLLMVAHSYLRRASPKEGLQAAVDIADVHLRHQRYQAIERLADRVIPLGTLADRYLAGTLSPPVIHLIAARAIAYLQLKKKDRAGEMVHDFQQLLYCGEGRATADLQLHPWPHLVNGLGMATPDQQRGQLEAFLYTGMPKKSEWNREIVYNIAFRELAKVCRDSDRGRVLTRWRQLVPTSVEPVHAFAEYQASWGSAELSLPVLMEAMRKLPQKEKTLELLISAEKTTFRGNLDEAIQRAQLLDNAVPDEIGRHPSLTVTVARRALDIGALKVAVGCAAQACQNFPGTRTPIHLLVQAHLARENALLALPVLTEHLRKDPRDPIGLELLWQVRSAVDRIEPDLYFNDLMYGKPSMRTARFLAKHWLARGDYQRVMALAERAMKRFGVHLELEVLATRALMMSPDPNRRQILLALSAIHENSAATANSEPPPHILWALSQFILRNPAMVEDDVRSTMLDRYLQQNRSAEDLILLAEGLKKEGAVELAFRAYRDLTAKPQYAAARRGTHFITAGRLALRLGQDTQAQSLFRAALAFADGQGATLDLGLLARLRGRKPRLPSTLPVDSIRAAAIVGDRSKALAFLEAQLEVNPDNLSAQCVLACMEPKAVVSPTVRATADHAGPDLAFVAALLQGAGYAAPALEHITRLQKGHESDPVLLVFEAKARNQLREYGAVKTALIKVGSQLQTITPLAAETLEFLVEEDNPLIRESKLMDVLAAMLIKQGANAPPALMATLVRHNSEILKRPTTRAAVVPLIASFWLKYPKLAGVGVKEARILIETGHHTAAFRLLKLIEADLPPSARSDFLDAYYTNLEILAPRATLSARVEMLKEALRTLGSEPVHGAPLHFALGVLDLDLAQYEGTIPGKNLLRRVRITEREQLLRHLDAFRDGSDPSIRNVIRTLERLRKLKGGKIGLGYVDKILRHDPSLVPIWELRASWLTQLNRIEEAIDSLAWLPEHLDDPATIDKLIDLMARDGRLIEQGQQYLRNESLARASRFSVGLVQLRLGTYLQGAQAMVLATPREDGHDLYFRALALIALQTTAAVNEAQSLLSRLATEFPDSNYTPSAKTLLQIL